MNYPKPLSKKTLERRYREAGIDEAKSQFLHKLFLASSNLYGVISLRDLWKVCREVQEQYGAGDIRRKDLIAFSSLVRREEVPYYVFELDEIYLQEKRADLDREIVAQSLIGSGFGKWNRYYRLVDEQADKSYFLPEDLLAFTEPAPLPEETRLLEFLSGLQVTATHSETPFGRSVECEHVGKTLGQFSFRSWMEQIDYRYCEKKAEENPGRNRSKLAELEAWTGGSEAEKLVRHYCESCKLGFITPMGSIENVISELHEVGVRLTEEQLEALVKLLIQLNNRSHLWCNRGWKPEELTVDSLKQSEERYR